LKTPKETAKPQSGSAFKAALALLLVIVILGGAGTVFFIGWVSYSVPPGFYGVYRSRTSGIENTPLENGRFVWKWERLIPYNAEIIRFQVLPVPGDFDFSGSLYRTAVYANLANVPESRFSWRLTGEYSFALKPAVLPALVSQGVDSQKALDAWITEKNAEIKTSIERKVDAALSDATALDAFLNGKGLERTLSAEFPELEGWTLRFKQVDKPDFALYGNAKSLYDEYTRQKMEFLTGKASTDAQSKLLDRLNYDTLEKTGALLTKYPILLDYLKLEQGK
jgi:hypothetical protein